MWLTSSLNAKKTCIVPIGYTPPPGAMMDVTVCSMVSANTLLAHGTTHYYYYIKVRATKNFLFCYLTVTSGRCEEWGSLPYCL